MPSKVLIQPSDLSDLAFRAARAIMPRTDRPARVYAIPRGGIPAALAMRAHRHFDLVDTPQEADYIVDDLIDSGDTMSRVVTEAINKNGDPGKDAPIPVVLIDKRDTNSPYHGRWIVFPWEGASGTEDTSFADNVKRMLQFIGENPDRGGLTETPARVAAAWEHWGGGYRMDPATILKAFEDGAQNVDEMVMVRDIPFYTHCEHHLAPFFGTATVGYVPNGKIVGLSKINRLVDCFARRLQVQERLTTQIADALMEHLAPRGVGVIVSARHLCMESRGVRQQGVETITSALRGVLLDGSPRAEFLMLAKR